MQKVIWVCQLDEDIQAEIRRDAIATMQKYTDYTDDEIIYEVDNFVMNEKLINIIGYEDGMLDADKYSKYVYGL